MFFKFSFIKKPIWENKYFVITCFLLLNLLVYGYQFSANTYQSQDLPFIHKIIDPQLYTNDFFVQGIKNMPSLFVNMMGCVARHVPIDVAYFVFYLVAKFILFITVFNLTYHFFHNKDTCVLALFLFACSPLANSFGLFGGEPIFKFFLYHTTWTVPFLILSVYFFLRQKYIASLVLLSVCYYFSVLLANHVFIMFIFGSIAAWKNIEEEKKTQLKRGWILFFIICIPIICFAVKNICSRGVSNEIIVYLKNWHVGHYFPLLWTAAKWHTAATYFLFLLFFLYESKLRGLDRKVMKHFLVGIYTMLALGFTFGIFTVWQVPITLQFLRSDFIFMTFGLIFAARSIQKLIFTGNQNKIIMACILILFLSDIHIYTFSRPSFFLILFALFYLNENKAKWFPSNVSCVIISVFLKFFIAGLLSVFVFRLIPFNSTQATRIIILIFLGFLFIVQFKNTVAFSLSKSRLHLIAIIFMVLFVYFDVITYRLNHMSLSYVEPMMDDWHDVQKWAEKNTAKTAHFIVPPYINGFRAFSKRSVFVEKLDGGFMQLKPGFEKVWAKRMSELGYGKIPNVHFSMLDLQNPLSVRARSIYASNDEKRFYYLKDKYDLDYIVQERFRRLPFPLVYENKHFSAYKISNP